MCVFHMVNFGKLSEVLILKMDPEELAVGCWISRFFIAVLVLTWNSSPLSIWITGLKELAVKLSVNTYNLRSFELRMLVILKQVDWNQAPSFSD